MATFEDVVSTVFAVIDAYGVWIIGPAVIGLAFWALDRYPRSGR